MSLHPLRSKDYVGATPRLAHNFARDENDWYVEPTWCSRALRGLRPHGHRLQQLPYGRIQ
jgi:hypothetical protein